jgi:hypothetical protein
LILLVVALGFNENTVEPRGISGRRKMDLGRDEFREALDKRLVLAIEEDAWSVCKHGYRIEGRGGDRYLVPVFDIGLESKWGTIKPLKESNLVPDFVKVYRKGLERCKKQPLEPSEFEKPILEFVGRYGLGLTGERRWAGGQEETIQSYIEVMQFVVPLVHLFEALVSEQEAEVHAALMNCPAAWLCDIAAGKIAVCIGSDGEEYELGVKEHALTGLGYVVGEWFHKLCYPFAIPEPYARRLGQMHTGWGFSNLTGAMFWHLYQLLAAQSKIARCEYCNGLIVNARKSQRFCSNGCRYDYDYHSGKRAERARRNPGLA